MLPNLSHLLAVADFMRRDESKPAVKVQSSEKRMSPAIRPQVAMPCLLKERQCPFAYTAQLGEHRLFVGKLRGWRHDRRHLALGHARFNQSQRKVQPFVERY